MRTRIYILVAAVCTVALSGCSKTQPEDVPEDEPIVVEGDNTLVPIELTTKGKSFVANGNTFAYKLLQKVEEQEAGSFTLSPLSLNLAFGLLIEAAEEGDVLDEVCEVLGFKDGGREEIREYCTTMLNRLPEMDKLSKVMMSNLVVTNSRFGKTNPAFEKAAVDFYGALVRNMSFRPKQEVVGFVNDWAYEHTEKMIREVLGEDDVQDATTAVLANALYFNGKWASRFKKEDTSGETFRPESGKSKKVEMMKQKEQFSIGETEKATVLRLPYGNKAYAMNVFLPKGGSTVREVINELAKGDPHIFWNSSEVDVWLPKFANSEKRILLTGILSNLGMTDAFGETWLKIFSEDILSNIGNVFQVSSIDVSESGTEAAAVTVITTFGSNGPVADIPQRTYVFHADHPFVYTITETSTGAVLFAGVYRGE